MSQMNAFTQSLYRSSILVLTVKRVMVRWAGGAHCDLGCRSLHLKFAKISRNYRIDQYTHAVFVAMTSIRCEQRNVGVCGVVSLNIVGTRTSSEHQHFRNTNVLRTIFGTRTATSKHQPHLNTNSEHQQRTSTTNPVPSNSTAQSARSKNLPLVRVHPLITC